MMGLNVRRHTRLPTGRTTVALEPTFWQVVDHLADGDTQAWITSVDASRSSDNNWRASE